jgi:hypothetical protein
MRVLKDVYFTSDKDWIEALLKKPDPARGLRVYAGYSGWGLGQLQNEMKRGDWYVLPADADTIFDKDVSRIWPDLVQRASARPTALIRRDRIGRDRIRCDKYCVTGEEGVTSMSPCHALSVTLHLSRFICHAST